MWPRKRSQQQQHWSVWGKDVILSLGFTWARLLSCRAEAATGAVGAFGAWTCSSCRFCFGFVAQCVRL
eukprot:NODE_8218_length_395_cov_1.144118.p1 GENE.NODE_8218_length_395_cov_1.144118~~NODE_8218_length_395_cov_1.144118.p1  ORF type:complete len:68 (-),score=0.87 NODE_8218_length_395_cov_1.144118:11-214(-)